MPERISNITKEIFRLRRATANDNDNDTLTVISTSDSCSTHLLTQLNLSLFSPVCLLHGYLVLTSKYKQLVLKSIQKVYIHKLK